MFRSLIKRAALGVLRRVEPPPPKPQAASKIKQRCQPKFYSEKEKWELFEKWIEINNKVFASESEKMQRFDFFKNMSAVNLPLYPCDEDEDFIDPNGNYCDPNLFKPPFPCGLLPPPEGGKYPSYKPFPCGLLPPPEGGKYPSYKQ